MLPEFVIYDTVEEYRRYYEERFCRQPIVTFDAIPVYFSKEKFSHAFYESSDRRGSKDVFSLERAKRMDWIKATLQSSESLLFQGWDAKKKRYFANRRVSIVYENFVVIIQISLKKNGSLKANFITCYQANNSIGKIKASPIWEKEKCLEELRR